jgi:molybdopterin-guanine dinucleotide biosynthesis protein A
VLEAAESERLLLVATDMPMLTVELVLALVAWPEADVVLPRTDYGLQPLCAIYRRKSVLPCARRALEDNRLSLQGLLEEMKISVLGGDELLQVDSPGRALLNVNTPEDRARLDQNQHE